MIGFPVPLRHGGADHQHPEAGVAARLVADRPHGVQSRQPGRDLRHLHLQPVAHDREHRRGRAAHPQDYLNVARVLNLSEWTIFSEDPVPAVLPYMITGVRLSIGVAWLVIVAAEMLTGGVGIGFWVWGRMEQPQRPAHHHRDFHGRHRRPRARAGHDRAGAPIQLRVRAI